jgi:hypothetical protein
VQEGLLAIGKSIQPSAISKNKGGSCGDCFPQLLPKLWDANVKVQGCVADAKNGVPIARIL